MTHILIRRGTTRLSTWLLLAVFGLLAVVVYALPAPASSSSQAGVNPVDRSAWRRTRDGWEQLHYQAASAPPVYRPLHPACLVTFQALITAMALVAGVSHQSFNRWVLGVESRLVAASSLK